MFGDLFCEEINLHIQPELPLAHFEAILSCPDARCLGERLTSTWHQTTFRELQKWEGPNSGTALRHEVVAHKMGLLPGVQQGKNYTLEILFISDCTPFLRVHVSSRTIRLFLPLFIQRNSELVTFQSQPFYYDWLLIYIHITKPQQTAIRAQVKGLHLDRVFLTCRYDFYSYNDHSSAIGCTNFQYSPESAMYTQIYINILLHYILKPSWFPDVHD